MSKDCGHHDEHRRRVLRRLLTGVGVLIVLVLLSIFITWAVLRPSKPSFLLQDATIYAFNVSSYALTSTIQITLASRNPNSKIGIYYDRLDAYASYMNQQITLRTRIGPIYQGHKDLNVWSPFLYGTAVPVSPYNGISLSQDRSSGLVQLTIRIDGRIRWKVGTFITGGYHLHVSCPAIVSFGSYRTPNSIIADGVKYQLVQKCSVNV